MLQLTRRPGEAIFIDVLPSTQPTRIRLDYVRLGRHGNKQIVLGLTAPDNVHFTREEIDGTPAADPPPHRGGA